jgi:hypothetical protein
MKKMTQELNIARWGELLQDHSSPSLLALKINPHRSLRMYSTVRADWERAPPNLLMIINKLNDMKIVYRSLGRAPTNLLMIINKL